MKLLTGTHPWKEIYIVHLVEQAASYKNFNIAGDLTSYPDSLMISPDVEKILIFGQDSRGTLVSLPLSFCLTFSCLRGCPKYPCCSALND